MNQNATKTKQNVRRYLEQERKALYGMYMGLLPGGFCQVHLNDRAYHIDYIIDEEMHRFYVDVSPHIICEKPYRQMMHAFANEKSSEYKSGRVNIDNQTGEVYIRVETSIADAAVSSFLIKDMERLAFSICDALEKRLEKLAHGVYFKEDDPELMGRIELLRQSLSEICGKDDSKVGVEDFMKTADGFIHRGIDATGDDALSDFPEYTEEEKEEEEEEEDTQ